MRLRGDLIIWRSARPLNRIFEVGSPMDFSTGKTWCGKLIVTFPYPHTIDIDGSSETDVKVRARRALARIAQDFYSEVAPGTLTQEVMEVSTDDPYQD